MVDRGARLGRHHGDRGSGGRPRSGPGAALPALGELILGGHDFAETFCPKRAGQLARSGVLPNGCPI
ncbi:MAG TPA: hypothetical protein VFU43_27540 [Streptosporangiaceae bacterium]|nr:hypothetical protein [Streptosporangiaceae bacterium]